MLKNFTTALLVASTAMISLSNSAWANTSTSQVNSASPEMQHAFKICDFAATGLAELVGVARQEGVSQRDAEAAIDKVAAKMQASADNDKDKAITKLSAKLWKDNIPMIYKAPIYKTQEEKLKFLESLYLVSMEDCMTAAATRSQ